LKLRHYGAFGGEHRAMAFNPKRADIFLFAIRAVPAFADLAGFDRGQFCGQPIAFALG
jgi:hypothetical protein